MDSILQWGNQDIRKLNNLPKVLEYVNGRTPAENTNLSDGAKSMAYNATSF